jgi:hypothetical protein
MEDVLELYAEPVKAWQPVVCVDERPCVLHDDTRPSSPAKSGRKARFDYEYQRNGTCILLFLWQLIKDIRKIFCSDRGGICLRWNVTSQPKQHQRVNI